MRIKKPTNELKSLKLFFDSTNDSKELPFALICKFIREKFSVTQDEMAKKLNIPVHTYKAWEQGKREPSSKAAFNLCLIYLQAIQVEETDNQLSRSVIESFLQKLDYYKNVKSDPTDSQTCLDAMHKTS